MSYFKTLPKPTSKKQTETQRILQLPRIDYSDLTPGQMTKRLKTPTGTMVLRDLQEQALFAIEQARGGFFPIGVGHGKSFIACLAPTVLNAQFAVILCPASTRRQLQEQYNELRAHFRLVPARIMSYSSLSQPSGTSILEQLVTDYDPSRCVMVCDEAHRLKRLESARTKRVLRFMKSHPEIAFVALSGTMTSKSLHDCSHLSNMALRGKSPIPRDSYHLRCWSEAIDVAGRPGASEWQMVEPLAKWAGTPIENMRGQQRRNIIREAFQSRLRSSPGVVASRQGSLGCSLVIQHVDNIPIPADIMRLMRSVTDSGITPTGDIIPDDITAWRTMRHLASGFYYRWDWVDGREDQEWLHARKTWNRHVRAELQYRCREGYDSPFLVSAKVDRECRESTLRKTAIHRSWMAWKDQKQKPAPPTVAVWVDKYLVTFALEWLSSQSDPSIIWFETSAIGDELAQHMPVYRAGDDPPRHAHNCAMSIKAHGIGKNLQSWSNQIILEPPTGGLIWEQLLGRTHRQGQNADEVYASVCTHAAPFQRALSTAIEEAQFVESSSGNSQKLIFATHS